jgi:hypothetical protein
VASLLKRLGRRRHSFWVAFILQPSFARDHARAWAKLVSTPFVSRQGHGALRDLGRQPKVADRPAGCSASALFNPARAINQDGRLRALYDAISTGGALLCNCAGGEAVQDLRAALRGIQTA